MEAAMQGSFEKPRKSVRDFYRNWGIGFFALPVLLVVAMIGWALMHPKASSLISDAVQSEFAGSLPPPEAAPTQLAQPTSKTRTVRAD
jgi:hypothetical protein